MGMLAERLGLSKGAIYHHVSSKEEILSLALERALGTLESVLEEDGATNGSALDRVRHVLGRAVQVLIAELPYVTLLLRLRGNTDVERNALVRRREFDRAVTALILDARDDGSLRSDIDPRIAERLVFGMINSIVEWYRPDGDEEVDSLTSDVLNVALEGLRR